MNPPQLIIRELGVAPRTITLSHLPVVIGRQPPAEGVVVQHPTVSRQHAELSRRGSDYWIIDLHSTNGTSVNGRRLQPGVPHKLDDGDIIRIGDQRGNSVGITFRQDAGARPPGSTFPLGRFNVGQLRTFTIGRDPRNHIHLNHPTVSRFHAEVRRTAQGHVIYDHSRNGTFVNGQRVMRQRLLRANDLIQIGPFRLAYDQVGFTQYSLAGNYRLDGIRLTQNVMIAGRLPLVRWLGGDGRACKRILNDVSISIYPREFVALVGASGAGKSTLLNALSAFRPARGQVLLNGDDLYRNFALYRSILGYVPQDDIIHRHLTVESALAYAARLRLPDASPPEIQRRIDDVLAQVEMTEHRRKLVAQLSGGQRKRVSIAVELLAEPGLFFLDEPTSGLDPGLEKKLMYILRWLADAGCTIVLVTHATANIDQCDHVAFMADGHLVYFGPPREALTFFNANDFADIYTRLSQPVDPVNNPLPVAAQAHPMWGARVAGPAQSSGAAAWAQCFRASAHYQRYVASRLQAIPRMARLPTLQQRSSGQRVSVWQQFLVLSQRYLELIRRDVASLFTLLAVMPIIGLLLLLMADRYDLTGLPPARVASRIQREIAQARLNQDPLVANEQFQASYQVAGSAQKLLFMLALAANLLGIFAAAYEIIKEEAIYKRERMVNLKLLPYLLSKISVLGLFASLQCLLLLLVMALKVKYPREGILLPSFLEMYITLLLATLASICLGLSISALVRSQNTVIYLVLMVLFVQIIFAGAIFKLPDATRPVSWLTMTRWTLEALGSTVDMEALNEKGVTCLEPENKPQYPGMEKPQPPCEEGQQRLPMPYEFYVSYGHTAGHLVSRWGILAGFALAFAGLTFILQRRKDLTWR